MGMSGGMGPGVSRSASSAGSPYNAETSISAGATAPRFNAGTGFAGSKPSVMDNMGRPVVQRQESAPTAPSTGALPINGKSSTAIAAARAAEFVNGSHAQMTGAGAGPQGRVVPNQLSLTGGVGLQASRPAPPVPQAQRPLLAGRAAPPAPKPVQQEPQTATERLRLKQQQLQQQQQADRERERERERMMPPGLDDQTPPQRQDSLPQDRPGLPPSKSSASAVSQPAPGSGGSATGPPQIKPLQTTKKLPKENVQASAQAAGAALSHKDRQHEREREKRDDHAPGSVAAAAAALEKPKEKERRISTMTEGQIMDKLRSVVNSDDPKSLYNKIKKIGQG